jgi:hypothetical protein
MAASALGTLLGCSADTTNGQGRTTGTPSVTGAAPGTSHPSDAISGGATMQLAPTTPGAMQKPSSPMTMGSNTQAKMAISIDQTGADNPAGLNAADVGTLIAGGPPGSLRWLYPYDGTVFPRGLLAPLLMWDGMDADAAYVHIKAKSFEYKGVLKPVLDPTAMTPQLVLPQDAWVKAGQQTNGQSDPFTLELSVRAGGSVQGPIVTHFTIAQATVKGSIYYNSYASRLAGAAIGGNVLRIPAGGTVELFMSGECNGCHAVSADGSRMLSQIELTNGGNSYQLAPGGAANPPGMPASQRVSFAALYPDGSKYLATSAAAAVGHDTIAQPAAVH